VAAEFLEPDAPLAEPGSTSSPRPAAAVILVRDGERGPEVLLLERSPDARFMPATWVFPGGAVEEAVGGDAGAGDRAHRAAAVRELREEAGVKLTDAEDELVEFARWITPAQLKIRFDARFFLARMPGGEEPCVDGEECVDCRWMTPRDALAEAHAGCLRIAFPTIKHLEQLGSFATVDDLIEHARALTILPVEPRVRIGEGVAEILLPGEPGYDD
jgi:8-oxo-dGTP pyrophosphatase MutT (NUDIX family)